MNELAAMWLSLLAILLFTLFMSYRIIKNLFSHDKASDGIVFGLDNIRYLTMFLSFLLTLYFGILFGEKVLSGYDLSPTAVAISYLIVLTSSVFVSFIISSMLVYCERALIQRGMSAKQKHTVIALYIIAALIDFSTMAVGFDIIANKIEDGKASDSSSLIVSAQSDLIKQKRVAIDSINKKISYISTSAIVVTKRVRTLRATLQRCKKKHKPCPDTHSEYNSILSAQHNKARAKLEAKRDKYQSEILSLTSALRTSDTIKSNSAEKKAKDIRVWGFIVAFFISFFNLVFSVARSILYDEVEEDGVIEVENNGEDVQHKYVFDAMKEYADVNDFMLEPHEIDASGLRFNFPRNKIMKLAKEIALRDKTLLSLGASKTMDIIRELEQPNGMIRHYLLSEDRKSA